ncbi:MAG: N-acetylmuramoyl-L-alanine amidase [Ruminococcaceae bacterium]|nr:N-acetylmuramoyl-L-alanine amidase [Oscillospiraceae bacterium]
MSSRSKSGISAVAIRKIVPILLVLTLVLSGSMIVIDRFDLFNSATSLHSNSDSAPTNDPSHGYVSSEIIVNTEPVTVNKDKPYSLKGATIAPGKDFLTDTTDLDSNSETVEDLIDGMYEDRLNTVNVLLNFDGGLICNTPLGDGKCDGILSYIYGYAKTKDFNVSLTVDIGLLADNHVADVADIEKISSILTSHSIIDNCDMLVLTGYTLKDSAISYVDYLASGSDESYIEYRKDRHSAAMNAYYNALLEADCSLYTGLYIDSSLFVGETMDDILDPNSSADVVSWLKGGLSDFCIVDNKFSTTSTPLDFETIVDFWNSCSFTNAEVYFQIDYSKVGSGEKGWTSPDQVVKQLMVLGDKADFNFTLSSYSDFLNDKTESRQAVQKFIAGQISLDYVLTNLNVTSPKKHTFTTYEDMVALIGASDPQFSLTLNGGTVERNNYGYFSLDLKLNIGPNKFVLEHKGSTEIYNITYKKVIIKEYSPTKAETVVGGSSVVVSIQGISDSKVTATLNGTTITLKEEVILDIDGNVAGEYSNYTGRFTVPHFYDKDTSLGNIKFTVASKYGTESVTAAKITVKKTVSSVPAETPAGGQYVEVSGSTIAEVTREQSEVFNINDNDDWSRPTNNYLPAGTVDHCSASTTSVGGSTLRTLRYGKMLYNSNLNVTNGTLPSTNSVSVSSFTGGTSHTKLILNVDWKAPFLFHIGPQEYRNEGAGDNRDYTMKNITFNYIDITFCYATNVGGDISIPDGNRIFSKAEWIKNTSDHTLRLYLKKTGSFYGWYASYNSAGQLVFEFLNPAKITLTNNTYGADLTGVTVMVDAGHGGSDQGALGSNKNFTEAYLNLALAKEVKAQLESIGATVIMTRDSDISLDSNERISLVRQKKPDYVLSIHRNAASSTSPNAFTTYHFNAFQANAAITMYNTYNTFPADYIFPVSKWSGTKWHPFFLSRTTNCPVVLTENGFITNPGNFDLMIDPEFTKKNAQALTQGVVDYFKSIQ